MGRGPFTVSRDRAGLGRMSEIVKAAIVQDAPRALMIGDSVAQAVKLATQAVETGAKVIAFGETFLGGYPLWLDAAPGAALWDHPGTKALHGILLEQALRGDDPRLVTLQKLADLAGVIVSIGGDEGGPSTPLHTRAGEDT